MTHTINTLHDFMLRTEGITYLLIVVALFGFVFFWRFLTGRDEDRQRLGADRPGEQHH
jgi:predicted permease